MGWVAGAAAARFRDPVGGARHPNSPSSTARCCMVGRCIGSPKRCRSVCLHMIDSRGTPYRTAIYCNACKLSRSVLQVCLRRLVFVCTSCKAFQVAVKLWNKKQYYRSYCCSLFARHSATLVSGSATLRYQ